MDRFLEETFKIGMIILVLAATVISIGIALMVVGWVLLGVKSIWSLIIGGIFL